MNVRWHAEAEALARYASGELDDAVAASLEAHLLSCPDCRARLLPLVDPPGVERMWTEIQEAVDAPRLGPVERVLLRLGVPDHVSRLLAGTPSLRLSWLGAVGAAMAFAVLAAHGDRAGLVVFLTLAPLVPVAGVAAAFGRGMDPTYEVAIAAPLRSFRLLLLRGIAVLAASLVLVGVAALALPRLDWTAAAWLLPAFALTLATLAASTVTEPIPAAIGVAVGWVVSVMLVGRLSNDGIAAFHGTGQVVCLAILGVAGAVLASRTEAFERRRWG